MVSIETILENKNIDPKDTVYWDFSKDQLSFPMAAIGEFYVGEGDEELECYSSWQRYRAIINEKYADKEYLSLKEEMEALKSENKKLNDDVKEMYASTGQILDEDQRGTLLQLRERIKEIKTELDALNQRYEEETKEQCISEGLSLGKQILYYKKELQLNSYDNIRGLFPFLPEDPELPYWKEMPFYTGNLEKLKNCMENGEQVAVEGGPCLFGLQEVYVVITMKDGATYKFDYNTAHYGPEDTGELGCEELEELVLAHGKDVVDVSFIDRKKGLTRQEYYELWYPFALADMFNAKLIVPLPDMSYKKYLTALVSYMPEAVADIAIERFCAVIHRIADLMINKLKEIAKRYPKVEYILIHDRTEDLKQQFYDGRKMYAERSKSKDVIKSLTDNELRQQSIYDYVTMPAMPLYFYGIKNIIQIDCMNEVDSYRKCRKIHNTNLNLCSMMYPEYISKDGKHTVFYSKIEDKDYLEE